jgi:amidase
MLFSVMIGSDPADPATRNADSHREDYAAGLSDTALKGMRIGVIRPEGTPGDVLRLYEKALGVLEAQGAVLVEVKEPELKGLGDAEFEVLKTELKADLNAYLATTPESVETRTLADLIAFNAAHADAEMPFFGQEIFIDAEKTQGLDDPAYKKARATSLRLAGAEGIDAMLKTAGAQVLVEPTYAAAWLSDPVYGDQYSAPSSSTLPAVAGYPNLTVPMGLVDGLPVGLSFIGTAYSEATLLGAGYDYEQASHARVPPKYLPHADVRPGLDGRR